MFLLKRSKKETKNETPKKDKPRENKPKKEEIEIKNDKWFEAEGELAVDVYQTKDSIVIEAPVAGIKVEDLDITVEDDTIKIKGERNLLRKIDPENYLIKECYWGSFSREIIVPVEISGSKAEASMEQGILVIKIPKTKKTNKKKIKVKEK